MLGTTAVGDGNRGTSEEPLHSRPIQFLVT